MRIVRKCHLVSAAALFFAVATAHAQNFNMIGYATVNADGVATTTGGSGGTTVTITTLDQLVAWAAGREKNTTPGIAQISGKISAANGTTLVTIKNGANITIQGAGTTGELSGVGLNIRDYNNVIVKNMKIHEVIYPDDGLTLDSVVHGWIDHCELYSKIGPGITVDTYDGLLDIKKGSRWITVSWCYLHDHMKCSLIGHTDNAGQQASDGQIRVTYHHNYFAYTDGRNPSLRFGAVHLFNNYYGNITDYGLAARDGAHAKVENCHYENVLLPMSTDKFPVTGLPNGYICQTGNNFTATCGANVISQTGCDFWNSTTLPYAYTLDPVSAVKETVQKYAGFGNNPQVAVRDEQGPAAAASKQGNYAVMTAFQLSGKAMSKTIEVYDINGKKVNVFGRTGNVQKVYVVRQVKNGFSK